MQNDSRYSRHIALPNFGIKSQQRLRNSTVALCGLGGVAAAALPLLAGAGFGKIKILDGDKVSFSNLHRQSLYGEGDIGKRKADAALQRAENLNSETKFEAFDIFAKTPDDLNEFLSNVDLCIDTTDSFKSRLLISDSCKAKKIPLIFAAASEYLSQVAFFDGNFYLDEILDGDSFKNLSSESLPIFSPAAHQSGILAASEAIFYLCNAAKKFPARTMILVNFAEGLPEFKKFTLS